MNNTEVQKEELTNDQLKQKLLAMEDELKRAKLKREMAEAKAAELNSKVQFMEKQKQVVEQPKEKAIADKANNNEDGAEGGGNHPAFATETGQEATPVVNRNNGNNSQLVAGDTGQLDAQFQVVKPRAKAAGERLWCRKARNLVAAARYRVMERKEREEISGAMELLHARNRELRADIFAVQTGINFLKGLLPLEQPKTEPAKDLELDVMPALSPMKSMDDGGDQQQQQQRQDDMPTTSKTAATANLGRKEQAQQPADKLGVGLALGGWQKADDQLTVKLHGQNHQLQQQGGAQPQQQLSNGCKKRHPCKYCPKSFDRLDHLTNHSRTHTGERPFACEVCPKRFAQEINLKNHLRTHITRQRPYYRCEWCNGRFARLDTMKEHLLTHTAGENAYGCKVCGERFARWESLYRHHLDNNTDNASCKPKPATPAAAVADERRQRLEEHEEEQPDTEPAEEDADVQILAFIPAAPEKNVISSKIGGGVQQQQQHRQDMPTTSTAAIANLGTHTGERPFKCVVCHKRFAQSNSLKEHTRSHTGEKPYQCAVCSKGFTRWNNLREHIRIHTGEKPFKCPICGERFTRYTYLTRHWRLRKGPCMPPDADSSSSSGGTLSWHGEPETEPAEEGDVQILDVGKIGGGVRQQQQQHRQEDMPTTSAAATANLGRKENQQQQQQPADKLGVGLLAFGGDRQAILHVHNYLSRGEGGGRGHAQQQQNQQSNGQKRHPCKECPMSFARRYDLKRHLRTHTGERPFKCYLCHKRFTQSNSLKLHMRIHTGEKPFKCPICGERFTRYTYLTRHWLKKDPCTPPDAVSDSSGGETLSWHGEMDDLDLK